MAPIARTAVTVRNTPWPCRMPNAAPVLVTWVILTSQPSVRPRLADGELAAHDRLREQVEDEDGERHEEERQVAPDAAGEMSRSSPACVDAEFACRHRIDLTRGVTARRRRPRFV